MNFLQSIWVFNIAHAADLCGVIQHWIFFQRIKSQLLRSSIIVVSYNQVKVCYLPLVRGTGFELLK